MTLDELKMQSPITPADVEAFVAGNTFPLVDPRGVSR